jgi:lysophospholipid acyltransferase (LPLAT)-like uncharacterized protein
MKPVLTGTISRLYWIAITFLYKTARIQSIGEERIRKEWSSGKKFLFGIFHGDYLLLVPHFGGNGDTCVFTTQSRRGELIAKIVTHFGYRPCFIPDRRGSGQALERMTGEIQKGYHSVIVVDGPLGPYHKVKRGIVILAKCTGNPIVPIGIASAWRIVLKKRWDRYTIPLPFSRTIITLGEPLHVPEEAGDHEIELFRQKVEDALVRLNSLARDKLNRQRTDSQV